MKFILTETEMHSIGEQRPSKQDGRMTAFLSLLEGCKKKTRFGLSIINFQ